MNKYYTISNHPNEIRVMYTAPCGQTQHMATIMDLGTKDERIYMHVDPVVPNTLRRILELVEANRD